MMMSYYKTNGCLYPSLSLLCSRIWDSLVDKGGINVLNSSSIIKSIKKPPIT